MVGVIAGQPVLETVDGRQCHLRAVKLGDRDGPVEGDDRRGVEADELVVEGDDLRPAGGAYVAGRGVHGADRGEDLVATRSHPGGQALAHQPVALGDQRRVPAPRSCSSRVTRWQICEALPLTAQPTVKTSPNVPMNSVTYMRMCDSLPRSSYR
jgi:hypothetical protein